MQVPKKILKIWKRYYGYGTLDEVSEGTGLNRSSISRIMNSGRCEEETFQKLNAYFLHAAEMYKKRMSEEEKKFQAIDQD